MKTSANPSSPPVRSGQAGITLLEGLAVLAVGATIVAFAVPKIQEMFFNTNVEQAYSEIVDVVIAGQRYRAINSDYSALTATVKGVKHLKENGYGLQKYTDGEGENAYGLDIKITVDGTDSGLADISYEFDSSEACEQIEARVEKIRGVNGSPACNSDNTLEFEIN